MTGAACLSHSILGVSAVAEGSAAAEAEFVTKSVQQERLFELDRRGNKLVAVGDSGLVMRSSDGGSTWERETVPDATALFGVAMVQDRTVVVGQQGAIHVHSPDKGWKKVESGTKERLLNLAGNSKGLLVAVGAFGVVIRSTDAGETWQKAQPDWLNIGDKEAGGGGLSGAAGEPSMYAVEVLENDTVFIAGELAFIVKSENGGQDWQLVNQAKASADTIAPTINSLDFKGNGVGYAAGQSGLVLKTSDSGQSWQKLDVPTTSNLLSIAGLDSGAVVAVGMRSALKSSDGGMSWKQMTGLDFLINWYSSVNSDAGTGDILAVGHSAAVVKIK